MKEIQVLMASTEMVSGKNLCTQSVDAVLIQSSYGIRKHSGMVESVRSNAFWQSNIVEKFEIWPPVNEQNERL